MKKIILVCTLAVTIILLGGLMIGCSSEKENKNTSNNDTNKSLNVDTIKDAVPKENEEDEQKVLESNTIRYVANIKELGQNKNSDDTSIPTITLNTEEEKFTLSFSVVSSYLPMGTYEMTDTELILKEDGGNTVYKFDKKDDIYVFNMDKSVGVGKEFSKYIPNGTEFTKEN